MSAPREIWLQTEDNPASTDAFKVVSWCESALNSTAVPYILKSDYDELQAQLTLEAMAKVDAQFKCDELQAKLTDAERLNKVALEAIRLAVRQNSCEMVMTGDEIRKCESAIKELERP